MHKFDDDKSAIINPKDFIPDIKNVPKIAIACYSYLLFTKLISEYNAKLLGYLDYTCGHKELYIINYLNREYLIFMMSVGGPAAATCIEDIHALGCNKFIVFGNCGVLDDSIEDLSIIIPTRAIRDEGVSYHYEKESDMIDINKKYKDIFEEILKKEGYSYIEGITWTTDSFYRETKKRYLEAKEKGAVVVEMEAASIQAVCNFRNIDLFTFFYSADNLAKEVWDKRSLSGEAKKNEKLIIAKLAVELASKM